MMFVLAFRRVLLCSLVPVLLSGCIRSPGSHLDEEKDPYFVKGKQLVASMDYKGAVEAFENAVEANPRSSAAHLELGILNEEHVHDYAAAIYHFQKHLELREDSHMADVVRDHIRACKLELAKSVDFALKPPQIQREIDQLASENTRLRNQIQDLQRQLLEQRAMAQTGSPPDAPDVPQDRRVTGGAPVNPPTSPVERTDAALGAVRTYTVKEGDNLYQIALRHGLTLKEIERANPDVEPRRLKIGQQIRIPVR